MKYAILLREDNKDIYTYIYGEASITPIPTGICVECVCWSWSWS